MLSPVVSSTGRTSADYSMVTPLPAARRRPHILPLNEPCGVVAGNNGPRSDPYTSCAHQRLIDALDDGGRHRDAEHPRPPHRTNARTRRPSN
jgi:hypothetical protein